MPTTAQWILAVCLAGVAGASWSGVSTRSSRLSIGATVIEQCSVASIDPPAQTPGSGIATGAGSAWRCTGGTSATVTSFSGTPGTTERTTLSKTQVKGSAEVMHVTISFVP
ncbi:MAG: hypothetical protein ABIU58_04970 [Ramlibacter sp.]